VHQVEDQPRLYYDARSTNQDKLTCQFMQNLTSRKNVTALYIALFFFLLFVFVFHI